MMMIDLPREEWENTLFKILDENSNRAVIHEPTETAFSKHKRTMVLKAALAVFSVAAVVVTVLAAVQIIPAWTLSAPMIGCICTFACIIKED